MSGPLFNLPLAGERWPSKLSQKMVSRSNLKRIFTFIFSCLCVLGATYQVSQITSAYLRYNTTSMLEIIPATAYHPQTMIFCARYTDILNFTEIREDSAGKNRTNWKRTTDADGVRRIQHQLTIKEIFHFTPHPAEVIESATVRKSKSFEQHSCNTTDCYTFFQTSKFVYLEYVCYSFRPLYIDKPMSYHSVSTTPSSAGQIFFIQFTHLLNQTRIYKVCFEKLYALPYQSLPISPLKKRSIKGDEDHHHHQEQFDQEYNSLIASTSKLSTDLLPRPYDTECLEYQENGIFSRAQCIQSCMNATIYKILHKIPFSVIVNKSIDEYMVSYLDTLDDQVTGYLFAAENQCRQVCHQPDCHSVLTFTAVAEEAGHDLQITLVLSTAPFTKITTMAQIFFLEFLTAAMSSVSTWTGIAIISFNPFSMYASLSKFTGHFKFKNELSSRTNRTYPLRVQLPKQFDPYSFYFDPLQVKRNSHAAEVGRLMAKNRILHQLY